MPDKVELAGWLVISIMLAALLALVAFVVWIVVFLSGPNDIMFGPQPGLL